MNHPLALLALLAVLAAAAPAFGQEEAPDGAPAEAAGIELTAPEVERALGERTGSARGYYDKRCAGDARGLERGVQQVCYRYVLCKVVEADFPPRLHREWCARRGNHEVPRDTGLVLAEQRVEAQAWTDADASIRAAAAQAGVSGAQLEIEGRREVLQACREHAAAAHDRPRHCLAAKLDEWRAPLEARLRRRWISDHLTQGLPEAGLVDGMSGAHLRGWGEKLMRSMREGDADRERVPLATAEAYDAFIRAQDAAAAKNTAQQREKERLAAEQRSAASAERLQRVEAAFERRAPDEGGAPSPAAASSAERPAPSAANAVKAVGGESAAGFRPRVAMRKSEAPPPP